MARDCKDGSVLLPLCHQRHLNTRSGSAQGLSTPLSSHAKMHFAMPGLLPGLLHWRLQQMPKGPLKLVLPRGQAARSSCEGCLCWAAQNNLAATTITRPAPSRAATPGAHHARLRSEAHCPAPQNVSAPSRCQHLSPRSQPHSPPASWERARPTKLPGSNRVPMLARGMRQEPEQGQGGHCQGQGQGELAERAELTCHHHPALPRCW